jgi:hypothetical protein
VTLGCASPLAAALAVLLAVGACGGSLPPLRGEMQVGKDGYVIFVAGASDIGGDLFAVRTEGGPPVQVTFTPVGEMRPALSPDGSMTAFLRGASLRDSTPGSVWVMNLLSGADREIELPKGAGAPIRVGWARDGTSIVIESTGGLYRVAQPQRSFEPARVAPAERAVAESALAVLLGDPPFARVVPCATRTSLCVQADTGAPELLAEDAHDPFRWGADSVAFFRGDRVEIRPVGPGRARELRWTNVPPSPREMTVFLGNPLPDGR